MKKADLMEIKQGTDNKLTKKVINVILNEGTTEEMESYMKGVLQHGCVSGWVTELIYYNDTVAFYNKYKKEINELLKDLMDGTGIYSPAELFGNRWDDEDPLAQEENNQNLLAWFGFEETVRKIADELELEY